MTTAARPETTTLPSGVRVVTEVVAGMRSAALGLWVDVGSRDEADGDDGASHFLEHLLFKGTGRRSARDIAEAIDAVGGEMNAFTTREATCYHATVLDRDLPVAFEVLADLVVDARNAPEDVELERAVVRSEIDAHLDDPEDLVHTDLMVGLLGTHPLARETLGTDATLAGLDRDRIHAHYLAHYRPSRLVVAAAGAIDHDAVVRLADALLGDLGRPGGDPVPRVAPTAWGLTPVTVRRKAVEAAQLAVAWPALERGHPDLPALAVLSAALGGGMSSRLFQGIRERRGLAYSTYSHVSAFGDAGLIGAYVGTAPDRAHDAAVALAEELRRFPHDLTDAEVARARASVVGRRLLAAEDTEGRMHRIGGRTMAGLELGPVDEDLARYEAVGVDDVRRLVALVAGPPAALAVVGPFGRSDRARLADPFGLAA